MDTDRCCSTKREPTVGVVVSRPVSDWFGLLLLVGGIVALIVVSVQASAAGGNPDKILRGTNMAGQVCGNDLPEQPFLAWPNPFEVDAAPFRTCVTSCSETNNPGNKFMARLYESSPQYYYCAPNVPNVVDSFIRNEMSKGSKLVSDLAVASNLIYAMTGVACVVSFIMLWFIRYCAKYVFWLACLLAVAGATTGGWCLLQEGQKDTTKSNVSQLMTWTGVVILVATAIFLMILCFLRKQLQIALEIVKEASKAISDLKSLIIFPIFPALAAVGYFVLIAYVALNLFSVFSNVPVVTPLSVMQRSNGTNTSNPVTSVNPVFDTSYQNQAYFLFFHLLWTTQFLFYFGFMVIAGAVAEWYFSKTDSSGDKIRGDEEGQLSHWAVIQSACRTMVFNLGTIAICSFIIAVIQFLRAVIRYIEKKSGSEPPNCVKKAVFCMIQCCLKCVECCCDKVNKNALIWTAIYGDGFIVAACSSFALIWRNLARVAALSAVSGIILNVGIMCTAILSTGIAALVCVTNPYLKSSLSSIWLPLIAVFVISYTMAKIFFGVVDAAIDTIFLCFLIDSEANQGDMFASKSLQALVGEHAEESQAIANNRRALKAKGQDATSEQLLRK